MIFNHGMETSVGEGKRRLKIDLLARAVGMGNSKQCSKTPSIGGGFTIKLHLMTMPHFGGSRQGEVLFHYHYP